MASTRGAYRPRHPERTVLYRVLAQHFERFLQVYDERFAPRHGPLPPGAQRAVHRYLDCGIFESGFARVRCGECGHDFFVAFSCKLRCICPSCHIKRELIWAQWAAAELLEDVPHRQLVFTIPKRLRPYFRYDRALLGDLAGCAWRALRLWILATLGDDAALPGAIGFIQTAGELLNFHPHLHLLITDGVLEPDGSFERLPYPDSPQLERLFRAELLRLLLDRGLITQEIVDNLLSWNEVFPPENLRRAALATAAHGVWNIPAVSVKQRVAHDEYEDRASAPGTQYLMPDRIEGWNPANSRRADLTSEEFRQQRAFEWGFAYRMIAALHEAGAGLLVGTDTPNPFVLPGFSIHEELGHFVAAGLSPFETLERATRIPAEFMGTDAEVGTVAVGKRADLILLEDNPLEDVAHVRELAGVVLRGRWIPAAEIDAMLAEIEAEVAAAR